ncbi:MAG: hypothetical protein JWR32_4463 [Mycobacterium sp.]|nr:hypothetical protein [Mycobacterium sp.]
MNVKKLVAQAGIAGTLGFSALGLGVGLAHADPPGPPPSPVPGPGVNYGQPGDPRRRARTTCHRLGKAAIRDSRATAARGSRATGMTRTACGVMRRGEMERRRGVGVRRRDRIGTDRFRRRGVRRRRRLITGDTTNNPSGIPTSTSGVSGCSGCGFRCDLTAVKMAALLLQQGGHQFYNHGHRRRSRLRRYRERWPCCHDRAEHVSEDGTARLQSGAVDERASRFCRNANDPGAWQRPAPLSV